MQTRYTKEDILRKVKALLANAQDHKGKNEHVAAAFAIKAQQLMQQWNIQENDLHATENDVGFVEYRFKSNRKWQKFLLDSICKTNFCKMVWSSRGDLAWVFGTEVNILFCMELFHYLLGEIMPLAQPNYAIYVAQYEGLPWYVEVVPRKTWNTNFYTGCVHMVGHRLFEQFEHAQGLASQQRTSEDDEADKVAGLIDAPDPSKMRALVVVQDKAIEEKLATVFPKVQDQDNAFMPANGIQKAGYAEGLMAGIEVTINKTLKGEVY
ncbi:MAG: hypothetical protein AUG51_13005 [Acidobacteria bacterium 13_1_20CM_3_53_8]|nr:MAG: hypothetical protein AUG51_13005 [Acidobacteria bacterium 13_1_20CM_3_53_8]